MIDSHSQPVTRRSAGDSRTFLVQVVKRRKVARLKLNFAVPPPRDYPAADHG
jgi:hypothetical protein